MQYSPDNFQANIKDFRDYRIWRTLIFGDYGSGILVLVVFKDFREEERGAQPGFT